MYEICVVEFHNYYINVFKSASALLFIFKALSNLLQATNSYFLYIRGYPKRVRLNFNIIYSIVFAHMGIF